MKIKVHESYREVVALCDSDLLGKKFVEGNKQLELKEHFFAGEEVGFDEAIKLLKSYKLDDATFNIVGLESVDAAFKAGVICENNVGNVGGIPFALVLL